MKKKKSERTKEKIIKTFYQLNMEPSRPLSTVSQICDELEIAVSTFYCHFCGINDLIEQESEKLVEFWDTFLAGYMRQAVQATPTTILPHETVAAIIQGYMNRKAEHLVLMRPDLNLPVRQHLYDTIRTATAIHMKFFPELEREYAITFLAEGSAPTILSYLAKEDMSVEAFTDLMFFMGNAVIREAEKFRSSQ